MLLTLRGGPESLAPKTHGVPVYLMVFPHSSMPLARRTAQGSPGWSLALAPGAISELVRAVPALALGARFHGAMLGALWRVVCGMPALGLEPLAGILDLRLDAGEVHPAQGDQDFMAVQGGFQRDAHRCLWQGRRGSFCLRLCGCLSLAVGAS